MTLEELRRMAPGPDRIRAVAEFVRHGEEKLRAARRLRDDDVRQLLETRGPAQVARMTGLSLSTVKIIKGRP